MSICKIFGHKWSGLITGVTGDRHPIGRCDRCNMPIVDDNQRVASYMNMCYNAGKKLESVEEKYQRLIKENERLD